MFLTNLSNFFKSNIKQYKDEKQLEIAQREEILLKYKGKKIEEIYELDKKLAENENSTERKFINRAYKALTNKFYILIGKIRQFIKR